MAKILLGLVIVLLGVVALFVVLFVAVAAGVAQALTPTFGFGSSQALAWLQDTPQPTGADFYGAPGAPGGTALPSGPVFSGGQVTFAGYDGPLSFLCMLPVLRAVLTDRYGTPRPPYAAHSGIDYGTCFHQNQTVFTPFGGQVVYAGWSRVGYGNLVVIENHGWQVYLAHNNSFLVHVGDVVNAGDAVSLSGSTGNSSGPHVHFEVRACVDGHCTPRNPLSVLLPGQDAPCDWYALPNGCGG